MAQQCPLTELKKILLATDGSDSGEGAVREAISLAGRCTSELYVVLAVETFQRFASLAPYVVGPLATAVDEQEEEARRFLEGVKARAEEKGVKCTVTVKAGDPFNIIIEEARRHGSELIIVGRRGNTRFERVAMGSVTAKVIGNMPGDVLVVPRDAVTECKNVMAATDGSRDGETAVAEAIKMARKCGASLKVLSVAPSPGRAVEAAEALAKAEKAAADESIEIQTLTATGKPYVEITRAAEDNKIDLLVVGRHGRGKLDRLLMGSVTERVVGHSGCAVLVARSF